MFSESEYSGSSESAHSLDSKATLADLPQLCDDMDCSYPIGPACAKCCIDIEGRRKPGPRNKTGIWAREVGVNAQISIYAQIAAKQAHPVFVGGASYASTQSSGTASEEEDSWEDQSASDGRLGIDPLLLLCASCRPGVCRFSSSRVSRVPRPLKTGDRVDRWLDAIFAQDLAAKGRDEHFVGGAEDQDADLSDPPFGHCERCRFRAVDGMEALHELQCAYASREQALAEASIARAADEDRTWKRRMATFGGDWAVGCLKVEN
ncbi:uncharacterized protein L3040_001530 [Drepanopeziza brunnea f. sp. 'multigermtubi']|uniref:Uncharacterized protein n=1 Tax=Marssonina brunnea f. sp. multigermtubi (strain MB_m1) TaxID=1072389 RepID=K1X3A1_MARBU|nr:uncharacterized protein MBM_06379 [Drepanopeziza brunnea f. sp. 'multigermtubi' MB_m1]EKD15163.1 hypothetical protein MBM_06379 [Drepanopeziza brunnea f. sp. 'multigermtubi' MB_m1]KAJ5051758.1 hypothetical protein L3040_001530 [Drepanopeziza brunnea f. sp. 'multigermtubi']